MHGQHAPVLLKCCILHYVWLLLWPVCPGLFWLCVTRTNMKGQVPAHVTTQTTETANSRANICYSIGPNAVPETQPKNRAAHTIMHQHATQQAQNTNPACQTPLQSTGTHPNTLETNHVHKSMPPPHPRQPPNPHLCQQVWQAVPQVWLCATTSGSTFGLAVPAEDHVWKLPSTWCVKSNVLVFCAAVVLVSGCARA